MNTLVKEDNIENNILGNKYQIILSEYQKVSPDLYLELGCFRLNTAINLMRNHMPNKAYLFDLFEKAPDFELPPEQSPLTINEAKNLVAECFPEKHQDIHLIKGHTGSTVEHIATKINSDSSENVFAFVDGGHSYVTTLRDLINLSAIRKKMTIVIDDADWTEIEVAIKDAKKFLSSRNPLLYYPQHNVAVFTIKGF